MSAAARAEARRKAILSRGTDRLAKLTTSARGEDAPAYMHDDPPLPNISRNFLGEESSSSNMPTPNRFTPSPSPSPKPKPRSISTPPRTINQFDAAGLGAGSSPIPDPSVWSPEQQQQFMQALMGAAPASPLPQSPLDPFAPVDPSLPPMDNPLAMLFQQAAINNDGAGPAGGMFPPFGGVKGGKGPAMGGVQAREPTKLQKAMPLLHMLAMWCLLVYFVVWMEPKAYEQVGAGAGGEVVGVWRRWAELGRSSPVARVFRVQLVPFFWAFTTLQIILHSLRIFSGFDTVQPPALLALALPHFPPPIPSIIMNVMKYMQMGSVFLDDLAGLVVGIGFIVYFAGLFAS
ncbi:hypothetical protein K443DRAFT_104236 [Laccaria amethystina LaAM-08-1]|uniref:Golgi to ER traffic protein 2 n=1 Tax=Laccaria amethystina LaAM-08-1 TaxID=1095629 RepID=A0A0C9X9Z5_9AGAR|nr:hypothetical protein K443DRAFT_104236 [Laccaria amethystina LaAM-08-1]